MTLNEAQKVATKMLEATQKKLKASNQVSRELDYLIQTNLIAFVLFWKIEKFEQATRYIELSKSYIQKLIHDTGDQLNEDSLMQDSTAIGNDSVV